MSEADAVLTDWRERIRAAAACGQRLRLVGGGSKDFLGRPPAGGPLVTRAYAGVTDYAPSELVISARCGTPLAEVEALLAEAGQMLPFEPPHFGPDATLGGAVACGLAGPARPSAGGVRDAVLGVRILDGRAQDLRFGGQVMKNVAGFDVSRLMVGSMGTLALILEVSMKVLPRPECESTLVFELDQDAALARCVELGRKAIPISATAWVPDIAGTAPVGRLYLRLSGRETTVVATARALGGETLAHAAQAGFWQGLREQTLPWFAGDKAGSVSADAQQESALYRILVPAATPVLALPGEVLNEWGGCQRWLRADAPVEEVRQAVRTHRGQVSRFRGGERTAAVFEPLPAPLRALHARLRAVFDPSGVFDAERTGWYR